MPGMTSAPRNDRRDFELTNCLHETGADCNEGSNSHVALWSRYLQGSWPARAITDEPYDLCGQGSYVVSRFKPLR